jgi:hypothetical protein
MDQGRESGNVPAGGDSERSDGRSEYRASVASGSMPTMVVSTFRGVVELTTGK